MTVTQYQVLNYVQRPSRAFYAESSLYWQDRSKKYLCFFLIMYGFERFQSLIEKFFFSLCKIPTQM
jgi:hypothetical protein